MKFLHIFFDVSMSNGHNGLSKIIKAQKNIDELKAGDYILFINRRWTALKMLTPGNIILHQKVPRGIDPMAIRHLPNCVRGADINYTQALRKVVLEKYKKYKSKSNE